MITTGKRKCIVPSGTEMNRGENCCGIARPYSAPVSVFSQYGNLPIFCARFPMPASALPVGSLWIIGGCYVGASINPLLTRVSFSFDAHARVFRGRGGGLRWSTFHYCHVSVRTSTTIFTDRIILVAVLSAEKADFEKRTTMRCFTA